MNIFYLFYQEILWKPILNSLVLIYNLLPWPDLGVAIIFLTFIIRAILTPLMLKARRAQKGLEIIQPEIKRIQEKFKDNREAKSKATMELYAQHKVNPFSGCLIMLVQLPILIAMFQVFNKGLGTIDPKMIYSFIQNPGTLDPISFGIINLAKGNIWLGVLAAITQFFQTKLSFSVQPPTGQNKGQPDFSNMLRWQSLYLFPALILFWSYSLPAALVLYWTILNILGILQEIILKGRK